MRGITSLDEYQYATEKTKTSGERTITPYEWALWCGFGLMEEIGEVMAEMLAFIQQDEEKMPDSIKEKLTLEVGDAMWYIAQLSLTFGLPLSTIATKNIQKLRERYGTDEE